ncbi:phosphatidate cytidylyltransferase [Pseudomarimonas arenosa]|uniref:Phosphatidate cytidylyltransferase n=1 Tax=Pseudomarimonas arenosa TaxID=2774145 RepID=A0AAW3ZQN5_9GAMM|nr:phosphatidate cytidylyltransferase [Pseudomarimonas arenosa]MBD8527230.1 phosphatidate cytidylyltransferase [Pseudomarimonas arenosa]
MKQRVLTALVLAPLAIMAVLYMPTGVFMALISILLLAGIWEWGLLAGLRKTLHRALVVAINAVLLAALAWADWNDLARQLIVVGLIWWILAALWLTKPEIGKARNRGNALIKLTIGTVLIVPAWSGAALLHAEQPNGPGWLLYAVMLVWAADTFAYFVGSRVGGRKLAPSISPGKTWAGFFGGLAGVMLVASAAMPLLGVGWHQWLPMAALALLTGLVSVLGDLFESLMKRQAGAKDSGDLLPGHGGALDRLDSLIAALPVFALGKLWLGL